MASETEIGWTDSTFNPWIGCQKVSPGCDHCYAEAQNQRFSGGENWGPKAPRRLTKQPWKDVEKWQRQADKFLAEHGRDRRVMLGSLCDIFDNAVDLQWTHDALMLAGLCPDLQFQLVTKRGQNMPARVPGKWLEGKWPQNAGILHSVVDQEEADRLVPLLLHYKAQYGIPWVGLSMEPLLGPVGVGAWLSGCHECSSQCGWRSAVDPPEEKCDRCGEISSEFGEFCPCGGAGFTGVCPQCGGNVVFEHPDTPCLDWIIVGGESGKGARPMHPDWVRSLRDQCAASGTPFFFKQWGEWLPWEPEHGPCWVAQSGQSEDHHILFPDDIDNDPEWDDGLSFVAHGEAHFAFQKVGKKHAGRILDGRDHSEFPPQLRAAP